MSDSNGNPKQVPLPEWDMLLSAAQKNRADMIRKLVEGQGVPPGHANAVGQSALHIAALWGNVEAVQTLLELGAPVAAANRITGATPLHMAAQSSKGDPARKVQCARLLLGAGADPAVTDFYGGPPSEYADDEAMKVALQAPKPLILVAIESKNLDGLIELFAQTTTVEDAAHLANTQHGDQLPLLSVMDLIMKAVEEGEELDETLYDMLSLLLEKGANPEVRVDARPSDLAGAVDPPLHQVCSGLRNQKDSATVEFLKRVGRRLVETGKVEASAETAQLLHDAARRGRMELAKYLIHDMHISVNAKGRQGMTPLMMAARSGKVEMVSYLLDQPDIDVTLKDDSGKTAMEAAKVNNKEEVISLLEAHLVM